MQRFCKRVIEYMYENRMNQFLSSFDTIFKAYSHLDEDRFFREWFERSIIRDLVYYFSPSALVSSYEEFRRERLNLLKAYVRIYWRSFRNGHGYPVRLKDSVEFFGLKELSREELTRKYREMVKRFHPDRNGKEGNLMMAKINYHYHVLRRYLSDRGFEDIQVGEKV